MADEPQQIADQLAILIQSELPLAPALRATASELPNDRLAASFNRLAAELESGRSLEDVLSSDPQYLPPHMRHLIASGAKSGKLSEVLVQFVDIDRTWVDLGRAICFALAYPALLLLILAIVFFFSQLYLLPGVTNFVRDFRSAVPPATRVALWFASNQFWIIAGIFAGVLLCLGLSARFLLSAAARRRLLLRIPLLGPVIRWRALALWSRWMELLLEEGTNLPEALQLSAAGLNDANLSQASLQVANSVAGGQTLANSLQASRQFPPSLVPLVRWGEEAGALRESFRMAGDMLEDRARFQAAVLQSSLPPIVFILVAFGAVFLLNSIVGPFLSLISSLTGHIW